MVESLPTSPTPTLQVDDGLARIRFDDPDRGANVLTERVMRRLAELVQEVEEGAKAGTIRGLLIESGKAKSFIVGADIDAIGQVESPDEGALAARLGQAIFLEVESLPIPTAAAIHGSCMGGGTELALACRYRLASDDPKTRIGLPEVMLGILPAWGGTTRLPRLIGLRGALDLILTGKTVDGKKGKRMGLVDAVLPAPIFDEAAVDFLRARMEGGDIPTGARRGVGARLLEDTPLGRGLIFSQARKQVMSRTGGHYPAPLRILQVMASSAGRSLARGFELEAEAAGELLASTVSKHLVHIYHLREGARKGTGVSGEAHPLPVQELAVVGAGVMGGGIAELAARNGLRVRLKDIRHEAVGEALEHARSLFDRRVERKRMTRLQADQGMERISGGVEYTGFGSVEVVVEAVVERMEVKQSVLREVEERVPERCILTTNTSTLSVSEMAAPLARPERFVGMHFFNPVDRMPLVEVIRGERSSDEAVAAIYALALTLDKVPVVVKDGPGFLVNRILGPYLNEAGHLLAEGSTIREIDGAAKAFGMPMGPLRLIDEVGIDVMRHAGEVLYKAFGDRVAPAEPLIRLGETGRLGKKGKEGFYRYGSGSGKRKGKEQVDETIYPLLNLPTPSGSGPHSEKEIRARLVLSMINEASRILEEGLVGSAGEVDLAMIMGTGFPPFRGGLLRFADEVHPTTLLERLNELTRSVGPRFTPAPLVERLAREDVTFYEHFPGRSP